MVTYFSLCDISKIACVHPMVVKRVIAKSTVHPTLINGVRRLYDRMAVERLLVELAAYKTRKRTKMDESKDARRYWLIYTNLDTLDDFCLAESPGNAITEEEVNARHPSPHRLHVMELTHRKFKQIKNDPRNVMFGEWRNRDNR